MDGKCKNCGADIGLHHYRTNQCPVGGVEAPVGRPQEYKVTVFESKEDDFSFDLSSLKSQIADLSDKLSELRDRVRDIEILINK